MSLPRFAFPQSSHLNPIWAEIARRRNETIARIRTWIRLPSIAAENRAQNPRFVEH